MIVSSAGRKIAAHLTAGVLLALVTASGVARAVAEDPYEPNNSISAAWDFTGGAGTWLSTYGGSLGTANDEDWYMISVTSSFTQLDISCTFIHASGDIDMELYDSSGNRLDFAWSGTDNESISFDVGVGGTYYILVEPFLSFGNTYDLLWDESVPPPDDPYEENDTRTTAYPLPIDTWLSSIGGLGIANDFDFYSISVTAGSTQLEISNTFIHANGDIDIALLDSALNLLTESFSETDNESISFDVGVAGTYYIVVYPYMSSGNTYDLWWGNTPPPTPPLTSSPPDSDDDLICACFPQQSDIPTLGNIFGAILSWLPLMMLLLLRNRQRRAE